MRSFTARPATRSLPCARAIILQQVFTEFGVGEQRAAVLDQNLTELCAHALVETLQDQISPSAWPKLILMPRASVTLRPGETSFTSPL